MIEERCNLKHSIRESCDKPEKKQFLLLNLKQNESFICN